MTVTCWTEDWAQNGHRLVSAAVEMLRIMVEMNDEWYLANKWIWWSTNATIMLNIVLIVHGVELCLFSQTKYEETLINMMLWQEVNRSNHCFSASSFHQGITLSWRTDIFHQASSRCGCRQCLRNTCGATRPLSHLAPPRVVLTCAYTLMFLWQVSNKVFFFPLTSQGTGLHIITSREVEGRNIPKPPK